MTFPQKPMKRSEVEEIGLTWFQNVFFYSITWRGFVEVPCYISYMLKSRVSHNRCTVTSMNKNNIAFIMWKIDSSISLYTFFYLFIYLSIHLFVWLSIDLHVNLFIYLSIYRFITDSNIIYKKHQLWCIYMQYTGEFTIFF